MGVGQTCGPTGVLQGGYTRCYVGWLAGDVLAGGRLADWLVTGCLVWVGSKNSSVGPSQRQGHLTSREKELAEAR